MERSSLHGCFILKGADCLYASGAVTKRRFRSLDLERLRDSSGLTLHVSVLLEVKLTSSKPTGKKLPSANSLITWTR